MTLPRLVSALMTFLFALTLSTVFPGASWAQSPSASPTPQKEQDTGPAEGQDDQHPGFDSAQAIDKLVEQLKKTWPNNRNLRVVFHGHSVPAGYFRTPEVRRWDSYPMLFYQRLCQEYSTATIDLSVTAIGGENSEQGAQRFQEDVLSLKPDLVFIDYSLNDRRIGLEKAELAWRKMIQACHVQGVPVVLLTPTPDSREDITDPSTPLADFSAQVQRLGDDYQVPVIDAYGRFRKEVADGKDLQTFLSQSNHPNRDGHQLVSDLIWEWWLDQDPPSSAPAPTP